MEIWERVSKQYGKLLKCKEMLKKAHRNGLSQITS